MNILSAIGNLPRDAELRFLPDSTPVLSFSVALNSGYGDKAQTDWLDCSLFGKRCESLAPILTKGIKVGVTGEFSTGKYPDKTTGAEKTTLRLRVNSVTLTGNKSDSSATPRATVAAKPDAKLPDDSFEDDIPF
tara:strand:- start:21938 stop:22339 length:402 start_codon:yes stop_codon:yes gene_type:complete